jgi:hypothetical protein
MKEAMNKVAKLNLEEEAKWAQRAKVYSNTQYFHLVANGKHRRKIIFQLEQDKGTIVGHENLKLYITEYYKSLLEQ